jgi:hypothetical protein
MMMFRHGDAFDKQDQKIKPAASSRWKVKRNRLLVVRGWRGFERSPAPKRPAGEHSPGDAVTP